VLAVIYAHFYFPTYSNGLKEVAGCLGFSWSEPDASGIESVVWRKNWEKTGDTSWKARLIQYNLEDCDALRRVSAFLSEQPNGEAERKPDAVPPRVAPVAQLDKLARTVTWSQYAHADFEFINKRAYFDYQRRHVFARAIPARARRSRKTKRRSWQNRNLRVTHRVEITATRCPFCKSNGIVPLDPKRRPKGMQTRRKRAFDLVITPGAIRRKVIEFRAVAYRCTRCERCFTPQRYERLARHFHGFMSWFAYQHITHRLGVKSLAALFYESFEIRVNLWEFLTFRHLLVLRYRKTYDMLLKQLIAGPVLHIDETEVKLTPLAEKIRTLRKAKGFTLDKLAELADSSKSYIWELENKNPPRPSADKIAKIAAALGVTADYLLDTKASVPVEEATDTAFYRKYQTMKPTTKERIRRMVELWGEDE
jgi:transcriptional regulator with XRE-family HTH domain